MESFFTRLGAQRSRLRARMGARGADLFEFAVIGGLTLPFFALLVRPGSAPAFGLALAPLFLLGWAILTALGPEDAGAIRRRDWVSLALALSCAGLGAFAFSLALRPAPEPAAEGEEWTPPPGLDAEIVTLPPPR